MQFVFGMTWEGKDVFLMGLEWWVDGCRWEIGRALCSSLKRLWWVGWCVGVMINVFHTVVGVVV